jgi:diguanylate cyclase (GGDEF)-like protein
MNVLIVEDSRSLRITIQACVEDLSHTALCAATGEEGLEIFKNSDVDLVLMDIELPGINGFEVTRRIRELLKNDWIPIIFLSAQNSDADFIEGIGAGGDAYLFKPVNAAVLQSMVSAMGRIAGVQEQLQEANRQLESMAYVDPLTKLLNRRGMMNSMEREWSRSNRNNLALSILLLDVDHFKAYNDFYGHLEGYRCLERISETLQKATLRPADIACRFGGEEFLVLLPETSAQGAREVGVRILAALKEEKLPHETSSTVDYVTVSIGVASNVDHTDIESMIRAADEHLYQAKAAGRNQIGA